MVRRWSDADKDLAIELSRAGLSFSAIGARVNKTRSSVAGMLSRAGVVMPPKLRIQRHPLTSRAYTPPKRSEKRAPASRITAGARPYKWRGDPPREEQITFSKLSDGRCKFPLGEPTLFCGRPAEHRRPYCAPHCARAYRRTGE